MGWLAIGSTKANTFSSSVASFLFFVRCMVTVCLLTSPPFIYFFQILSLRRVPFTSWCFIFSQSFIAMLPLTAHSSFRTPNWLAPTHYIVFIPSLILKNCINHGFLSNLLPYCCHECLCFAPFCPPHKNDMIYKSINLGFYFEIRLIFELKVFRI